ncbi:MAG: hypothetical protein ABW092_03300 [Candidatus Thiodiazotropha sp.]
MPLTKDLDVWVAKTGFDIKVVNYKHERTPDLRAGDLECWDLGVNLKLEANQPFGEVLNYLHGLAMKYKRDFVLGYYVEQTGISEDITNFGYEGGNPNLPEIERILGINC